MKLAKIAVLVLLFACLGMMLASIEVKEAKATTITVTRTFSSQTSDGGIVKSSTVYGAAWSATSGDYTYTTQTWFELLNGYSGPTFNIHRSFVFFDTSVIPDDAHILSAKLCLVRYETWASNYNATIQNGQPTYPHNPLVVGDYNKACYSGNGGTAPVSQWVDTTNYYNITLTSSGLSWINTIGITKLCLRHSGDINGQAPSGQNYTSFYSANSANKQPLLYVTYEAEGTLYVVHGPYYEDGDNATALITCVLTQPHNSSITFSLNGTDGNADTVNIAVEQPATYLAWNISASTNNTRIYYFLNTTFDEVWIYMPKPSEPCYPYEFGITDFCGMQNPYLETVINVNGTSRIVERKKLDVPTITFFMIQWHHYDLRFRCDQGVYTQGFSAETTWLTNIPILSGAFPTTPYTYPTVTVTRTSGSVVTFTYADPTQSTVWIYFQIYHYIGQTGVEDYTLNTTGNSYSYPWSEADNMTNYYVHTQAYADSQLWDWTVPALTSSVGVNPWDGLIWPALGTLPLINIDVTQVVAGVIILCVLGIFSYASAGVGCILSLLVAGIFVVLGWYVMSLPMFVFGAFVAIFVMIEEAKKTEREV